MHYHNGKIVQIMIIKSTFFYSLLIYSRFLLLLSFFVLCIMKILEYSIWGQWQQQCNANFLELYFFPNLRSMWHTGIIYISSAQQYIIHFFYCCFRTAPLASIFLAFAMFAHTPPPPPHVTTLSLWVDAMGKRMMMDWTTLAAVI